jgi:NADPH-dependent 2,4-dienoyl-CoA reductase/sulfur reductase-like enzyme
MGRREAAAGRDHRSGRGSASTSANSSRTTAVTTRTDEYCAEWGIDIDYRERGGIKAAVDRAPPREVWLLQRKSGKVGEGLAKTTGWIRRTLLRSVA